MRLSGQFHFFKKRKINNFPPLRSFPARKIVAFVGFCSLNFVLSVSFGLIYVFVRSNLFPKRDERDFLYYLHYARLAGLMQIRLDFHS